MTEIAAADFPVHARIRLPREPVARQQAAIAYDRSQLSGSAALRWARWLASRWLGSEDTFMRAHPSDGCVTEADLFDGVA